MEPTTLARPAAVAERKAHRLRDRRPATRASAVIAAAVLAILTSAGIAAADAGCNETAADFGAQIMLGQSTWTISWQARIKGSSQMFLLYAGQDLGRLRLVDIQRAIPGIARYQFEDKASDTTRKVYQLRYQRPKGDVLVLGTLRVDSVVGANPATTSLTEPVLKALQQVGSEFGLSLGRCAPPESDRLRTSDGPAPEVPPPELAG